MAIQHFSPFVPRAPISASLCPSVPAPHCRSASSGRKFCCLINFTCTWLYWIWLQLNMTFQIQGHPCPMWLVQFCVQQGNFSRRKLMGSAHPMDWILCPIPSGVQPAVGEGAGHTVETWLSRGCGAGGTFKKKIGTEVRWMSGGGNLSRALDRIFALGNWVTCLKDWCAPHLGRRRRLYGLVRAEGMWEAGLWSVRCLELRWELNSYGFRLHSLKRIASALIWFQRHLGLPMFCCLGQK